MKNEDVKRFVELGYKAAERLASTINAGNANEFAAYSLSRDLERAARDLAKGILRVQSRCHLDLSDMLLLDEDEQAKAVAAFAGGCLRFLEENPDE